MSDFFFATAGGDDADLFVSDRRIITKRQFNTDINGYVATLSNLKSPAVALYIPQNVYLFYVLFSALLRAGKDVILLSYFNADNIQQLRTLTDTVITDSKINMPNFECFLPEPTAPVATPVKHTEDQKIYFFTSGSTDRPKCIPKSVRSLMSEVAMHTRLQAELIRQKPVVVASVVPFHMYGMLWRFLFSVQNELLQDLDTIFYPEEFLQKQAAYDKILFVTTPSFMREIVAYAEQYTFAANCIGIYSSGSLLTQPISAEIKKMLGVAPYEIFGSTETGGIAFRQQDTEATWTLFPNVIVSAAEDTALTVSSEFSVTSPYKTGDSVQLIDQNHFVLNGRLNRLVKIAEKRISLPEIENYLCAWDYVKSAYFTTCTLKEQRTCLAAIVSLSETGKRYILENGKSALIMQIRQYLSQAYDNSFLPKKVRIVEKIPTTAQGKILQTDIDNILASKIQEPITFNLHCDRCQFSANLVFEASAEYFKGHFPKFPILPGVIQLYFVFYYIRLYFHDVLNGYTIHKLKFSNLITPNLEVGLIIRKLSDTEYDFIYKTPEKSFSSGKIAKEA